MQGNGLLTNGMSENDLKVELSRYMERLEEHSVFMRRRVDPAADSITQLRNALTSAEEARDAKSDYLADVSHRIRTALTAVLGYAEMLNDPDLTAADREAATGTIRCNAQHLLHVTDELLDVSRLEAGRLKARPVPCALHSLLRQFESQMQAKAHERAVTFTMRRSDDVPPAIFVDMHRLGQIMQNLVKAAIESTPEGHVELDVRRAEYEGRPALQFDICSAGLEEEHAELLEMSLPNSLHRGPGAACINHRVARLLGGRLDRVIHAPLGATLRLTVPLAQLPDGSLPEVAEAPGAAGTGTSHQSADLPVRILLAEDGPDNQRLIVHLLKRGGFEVIVADNGQEACEKFAAAESQIDLILMDVQMPVLDGIAATRRLRDEGHQVPIIALTAHASEDARKACLAAGCSDYLSKPIDRKRLLELVKQHAPRGAAC